jgi:hypothetical protein
MMPSSPRQEMNRLSPNISADSTTTDDAYKATAILNENAWFSNLNAAKGLNYAVSSFYFGL